MKEEGLYIGVSTMCNSPKQALAGIVAGAFHHAQNIYYEMKEGTKRKSRLKPLLH